MEREQIKKALECCTSLGGCYGCHLSYDYAPTTNCKLKLLKFALALINELTEENERCHKRIENQREEIRRLHNHIGSLEQSRNAWKEKAERLGKQVKELIEKNERLKADTVRKMQERLKRECLIDSGYEVLQIGTIDHIAKEMLEEDEGK